MAQVITQLTTATTGTITSLNTQQDIIVIHEAGVSANMTWALPANPRDGQRATLTSTGGITLLSITATVGTVLNALTGMVGGSPSTYMYYKPTNKWYKIR